MARNPIWPRGIALPLGVLMMAGVPGFAADPSLLNLVMPDAKVIAGLQVDKAKASPFGQYLLTHMQPDDPGLQGFMQHATEIVLASNADTDIADHWLILARGVFDPKSVAQGGIAFPDNSTAIIGEAKLVEAAARRFQTNATAAIALLDKVSLVSPKYDFWFVSLVPLSFAKAMPETLKDTTILDAITQATGGAKFGNDVQVSAELTARTGKDAEDLANALRFFVSLFQTNQGKSDTGAQVASLLNSLTLNTKGNVISLEVSLPEPILEQIVSPTEKPATVP